MKQKLKTVALLGRDTGLLVLKEALIAHPDLDISHVITHKYLTRKEGGGIRPELTDYSTLCQQHGINFSTLDLPDARTPHQFLPDHEYDLLVVLSWRYILPKEFMQKFRKACINIHRGALPKYAGSEPVKRAIEANEKQGAITAHHITEGVDEGPVICTTWYEMDPLPKQMTSELYAEIIKEKIKPLYVPLTVLAIQSVLC